MYRSDPLTHSISLRTGESGQVMLQDGMFNRQSDLDFGRHTEDGLSVGIEGGRQGVIIDLGSQDELAERYGYQETVGKGQGFASIRLVDGKVIGRHGGELAESEALFASSRRGAMGSAPAHVDHIYLVRLTDRRDDGFERIAKLIVVGHRNNESVTIRWVLLKDEGGR
jgi:hypothetical protein